MILLRAPPPLLRLARDDTFLHEDVRLGDVSLARIQQIVTVNIKTHIDNTRRQPRMPHDYLQYPQNVH
jgi:hypothetical protein